jgi:SAM-dependent methyltransferase
MGSIELDLTSRILDNPLSYRLWQAPFADAKLAPLLRHNDLARSGRALDVGCGPGTNADRFRGADYVGIDLNPRYIDFATRKYGRDFRVADATRFTAVPGERFDFILVNSFLHHIGDDDVRRLLSHLATLLNPGGHIHVLELLLPDRFSIARLLARLDRGEFPRPMTSWLELLSDSFEPVVFEPYELGGLGGPSTLWHMVYFKGRARAG